MKLLVLLLLVGCVPADDPVPQDEDLLIGVLVDGGFEAWADGDEVEWVWGSQGGTMIQPVLSLNPALAPDAVAAQLTLVNTPDPDFPGAHGELDTFTGMSATIPLIREGGLLRTEPLDNQLGWEEPSGLRLILEVSLAGEGFDVEQSVALKLPGDPPPTSVCTDLPTVGSGCVYRVISGTATVTTIEDGTGTPSCDERLAVEFDFAPLNPAWGECYQGGEAGSLQTEDGRDPPSACIDQLGIDVGSALPVEYGHAIAGTCIPWQWFTATALQGCDEICP